MQNYKSEAETILAKATGKSKSEVVNFVRNSEGWDSLVQIQVILLLESFLNVELTDDDVREIQDLDTLSKFILMRVTS